MYHKYTSQLMQLTLKGIYILYVIRRPNFGISEHFELVLSKANIRN